MRSVVVATLLSALSVCGVCAQSTIVPITLRLPGSTRALALGNAYQLMAPDPEGIFYNPALLLGARGVAISAHRYGDASLLTTLSTATDLNFGFGLQVLEYGGHQGRFNDRDEISSALLLGSRGPIPSGEIVGTVGYARVVWKARLGVVGKWAQHWGSNESSGVWAVDVGSTVNPISWLTVALAVQNLGHARSADINYDMPSRVALNLATRTKVIGPLDLSLAGHAQKTNRRSTVGGIGLEASYWPFSGLTFFGRGGVRFGKETKTTTGIEESMFTAGGGIAYGRVALDYAWAPFEGAVDVHRFGLRVR